MKYKSHLSPFLSLSCHQLFIRVSNHGRLQSIDICGLSIAAHHHSKLWATFREKKTLKSLRFFANFKKLYFLRFRIKFCSCSSKSSRRRFPESRWCNGRSSSVAGSSCRLDESSVTIFASRNAPTSAESSSGRRETPGDVFGDGSISIA